LCSKYPIPVLGQKDGYVLAYPHHGTHAVASGDVAVFVAFQGTSPGLG